MQPTDAKRLRALLLTQDAPEDLQMTTLTVQAAADIGNATYLVATLPDGAKTAIVRKGPTAKAMFGLRLPPRLAADEPVITREGHAPTALGLAALRYAEEPIAARGHIDRYGPFAVDFIVAGIASAAPTAAHITVRRLAVTVPAEFFSKAPALVTKALRKAHEVSLGRLAQTVDIRKVEVFREGHASWAYLGGKAQGFTMLINGGGGTTHVALSRGEQFIDTVTRGTGLQKVLDAADDEIKRRHGRRLSLLERYELEQALAQGKPSSAVFAGQMTRIDTAVRPLLDGVAGLIIDDVKSIVPKWERTSTRYLVGGQAFHLADAYKAAFPGLVIGKNPDEWDVRGALVLLGAAGEEAQDA